MDNDLMARRLRPPSEPPRPKNGHSPVPSESPAPPNVPGPLTPSPATPAPSEVPPWAAAPEGHDQAPWAAAPEGHDQAPWAAAPEGHDEVPWDHPQPETWPPADTDEQPAAEVWPPSPAPAVEPADEVLSQSMWDTGPATRDGQQANPWQDPAPWEASEQPYNGVALDAGADAPVEQATFPAAVVQEPEADVDETDLSVPGRAPWDKPEPYSWDDQEDVDDRPADMLEPYDEMVPRVARAIAAASAASAGQVVSDPDDSLAPVLNDVPQAAPPSWQRAATPPAFEGKVVGPTPPDDLFGTPSQTGAVNPRPAANAPLTEATSAPARQLQMVYSTSPNAVQKPLVLHIQLAIVDESNVLGSADTALRVGSWSDDDSDADAVTPRHPEFEPRNYTASPPAAADPVPAPTSEPAPWAAAAAAAADPVPAPTSEPAPWAAAAAASAPDAVDLPWALPPLEPLVPSQPVAQPDAQVAPWVPQPVQPAPQPQPQPEPQPQVYLPQPQVAPAPQSWADPNPTSSWTLEPGPADPLSSLPAATFAPTALPAQQAPAAQPQFAPTQYVMAPAPVAQPAPFAQPQPASGPVQAAARPAANVDQSDLWFLASEPEALAADEPVAEKSSQPSSLLTAGLTVAMAVAVIILVLLFIQLMTSLLH